MKKIAAGILAHVDAGKTTLSESMLYLAGGIQKLGRVDHGDSFLDNHDLERRRGITIFSKQAVFSYEDLEITLLDTPGHVDFSAEMERTLQVLDIAVLVISGTDGVQGHTQTLWRLLKRYRIPVFIFVNKMDLAGADKDNVLAELKKKLDDGCVDFSENPNVQDFYENLATCEEGLLNSYLETGTIKDSEIAASIANRKVFPCYFGSALKVTGVKEFLEGVRRFSQIPEYQKEFGAKVYKIARDEKGNRLTYLKVTGGRLRVKDLLTNRREGMAAEDVWEEKADQIRIYSGVRFQTAEEAEAGKICAVAGLTKTYAGQGLGAENSGEMPLLQPVLTYQMLLPPECDVHKMLKNLRILEEEDPELHIVWNEQLKEIHVQLMGEIQLEILKSLISERFGVSVSFGTGNIMYKESILSPVEGIGHFEPLRHYSEVHLLMEPLEQGSGLCFETRCKEDELDINWQRLILTHLEEKIHVGVLTGSPITDMRITLIAGRAHQKHTEGGDFRQSTYRAVRNGLMKAKSVLLEPYYAFRLEVPSETVGHAISDIQRMNGEFAAPVMEEETAVLTGTAPAASMRDYMKEVVSYTRGKGRLTCTLKGYAPCHNPEEVIERLHYNPEGDLENTPDSVFCAHGAGFVVKWNEVENFAHIKTEYGQEECVSDAVSERRKRAAVLSGYAGASASDKELEEIFKRTYGESKREKNRFSAPRTIQAGAETEQAQRAVYQRKKPEKEYLLVDGYNIIFSWDELKEMAKDNLDAARNELMNVLCNYQGFTKCSLILVFDAYRVKGHQEEVRKYHNIHVVYTKEAETADMYIEKITHEIGRQHHVHVATSDGLEQIIIMGQGALRMSARELKEEVNRVNERIQEFLTEP